MAICLALFVAMPALAAFEAAAGALTGFAGNWTATDCATWWEENEDGSHDVDCSIWGDGSSLTLHIGPGDHPRVVFQDSYASTCANNGSSTERWVAAGSGEYDDIFLWLTFSKSGCGSFGMGGYGGVQLYHDPGSDTIFEDGDGDGWGTNWYRAP